MLTYELERVLEKEKKVGYIDTYLPKSSHEIGTNVNYNYKNKRSNNKKIEASSVKPRKINPKKKMIAKTEPTKLGFRAQSIFKNFTF